LEKREIAWLWIGTLGLTVASEKSGRDETRGSL